MSLETQDDSGLSLKKRARRRLVGAITLVILMLFILPNILTNKAKIEQTPMAVNMPDTEAVAIDPNVQMIENAAGELLPVEEPEMVEPKMVGPEMVGPEMVGPEMVGPEMVGPEMVGPEMVGQVTVENSKVDRVQTTENTESEIAVTEVKPSVSKSHDVDDVVVPAVEKPVDNVVAKLKSDAEKVAEKVAAPPLADKASKASSGFVIQVGTFLERENVKRLQAKIESLGFASKTTKFPSDSGEMIRLSVGEFVSRDAAEKALKKLHAEGLKDGLVKAVK